jgi:hypothetical protein
VKAADPALEVLWKNVLDHWDNDAAHHAFLDHCQRHEALDDAATRYRGMKGDHERGLIAEKRLKAVLMLAMSKLEASRSDRAATSSPLGKLVLILFFLSGSLALLWFLMRS